jgi:hypothetical protein
VNVPASIQGHRGVPPVLETTLLKTPELSPKRSHKRGCSVVSVMKLIYKEIRCSDGVKWFAGLGSLMAAVKNSLTPSKRHLPQGLGDRRSAFSNALHPAKPLVLDAGKSCSEARLKVYIPMPGGINIPNTLGTGSGLLESQSETEFQAVSLSEAFSASPEPNSSSETPPR